ncbi:FIVAR domain-containing protein, partial [Pseudoflavonifractor capillosus]|uniref:InlB B-repeat-containing protein n=1 Tax=Pseudoflavonifractor capillosus TaxID=106588 RepID=UPI001958BD79|nr:FIVAR domain-containing protein [Pseudoflavonifractor capillosus]
HFVEWQSEDVTVTDNTFVMPEGNVTVTAVFEEDETPEPGDVNKTLLEKTVAYAETLSTDGVTDTAKKAFEDALANAKAVLADADATQDEVNAAWNQLLEGIWGLGLVQGDKDELNRLIAKAEDMMANADKYVETNWQQLVDALAAAQDVAADGDAMDEDIKPVAQALLDAILAQRFKADKSILEDLIGKAEGIDLTGYTAESVATFRTALQNAQAVMADETLTEDDQATVNAAVAVLSDAMDGLTAGGAPETTDKPEVTDKPESTDQPQATEKPAEKPAQTGDSAQLMLYVAALAAAVVALSTATVVRKRRG